MLVRIAAEVTNELARLDDGLSDGDHAVVAAAPTASAVARR